MGGFCGVVVTCKSKSKETNSLVHTMGGKFITQSSSVAKGFYWAWLATIENGMPKSSINYLKPTPQYCTPRRRIQWHSYTTQKGCELWRNKSINNNKHQSNNKYSSKLQQNGT